jgi:hypothetical protein
MRTALGLVASVALFEACSGWLIFIAEYQKRYDPTPYTSGLRSLGIGLSVFLFACVWLSIVRDDRRPQSRVSATELKASS